MSDFKIGRVVNFCSIPTGLCGGLRQSVAGAWLLLLHQCCHLAGVVMGVRTTLQYMAGHGSWLSTQMAMCPRSASLGVLTFIITLHILGLEVGSLYLCDF